MKMSKREKNLLIFLAVTIVLVGYYQFVYLKQSAKVSQLRNEKDSTQSRYNVAMDTINSLETKEGDLKILNAKISDKSQNLYPAIIQEKIILELDELLSNSNLRGNISFSGISVLPIEINENKETIKGESSLKPLVDEYNGKTSGNKINQTGNSSANNNENKSESKGTTSTVEQMKVTLACTGTYKNITNFISSVEEHFKKIAISNITMSQNTSTMINATMTLEFYSVPKLGAEDEEYLKWIIKNNYGKSSPFSAGPAIATSTIENESKTKEEAYDFVMLTRPISSDLPTVMLGRANDSQRLSYVYADNSNVEEVEITLTKENDSYYYKYKTSRGSYPLQYNGNGIAFTPSGKDIVLKVFSSLRLGDDDKAGVKLRVINKTDKVVSVVIEGEDSAVPRVIVNGQGAAVEVSNK